jgi:formate dehydrogenase subunit delta
MNRSTVLRLLKGIAAFHRAYPHEEAVAGIAEHVRQFWDPRMRAALAQALKEGAPELDPLLHEAALRAVGDARQDAA